MLPRACRNHLRAKRFTAFNLFASTDGCQVISCENFQQSTAFIEQRLFLPDEDTMNGCDNHSTSWVSTFDERRSDVAPDHVVDDARTHQTLLRSSFDVTTPERSVRKLTPSTIRRNNSYALSPSRIAGFIRRSGPYERDQPTINDSAIDPTTSGVNPRFSVDPADLDSTVDDPLAEFERWVASGAVEIIPD